MQASLSDNDWAPELKGAMLLANVIPLAHAVAVLYSLFHWHWLVSLAVLYLLPPFSVSSLFSVRGRPKGRYPVSSPEFLTWWLSCQAQTLFLRLPFLEELLRLVPGLYSAWLRLWGSRLGARTYWSPGTVVLDRSYLELGDDVVFGAGARLNGHVVARDAAGRLELIVDDISIGEGASVGGYSLLTAGTFVAAGETLRACLLSPPYSRWEGGRRVKEPA